MCKTLVNLVGWQHFMIHIEEIEYWEKINSCASNRVVAFVLYGGGITYLKGQIDLTWLGDWRM